jgi:hypothetical protein
MRIAIIRAFGETKEYLLDKTSISQMEWLCRMAKDFEILEYKELV